MPDARPSLIKTRAGHFIFFGPFRSLWCVCAYEQVLSCGLAQRQQAKEVQQTPYTHLTHNVNQCQHKEEIQTL